MTGRQGGFGGRPASFGRAVAEELVEKPVPEPGEIPAVAAAGVRIVDGRLVLAIDAELVLSEETMQGFYDQVRELALLAFADGMSGALRGEAPLPLLDAPGDEGEPAT